MNSIEWSSKNVTVEDGLVRLFGPPPECDELDRIDLASGQHTVGKKVVEVNNEDGSKMYLASVQVEFGEESSSSVHVVRSSQNKDDMNNTGSLSSLAQIIKDADQRSKILTQRNGGRCHRGRRAQIFYSFEHSCRSTSLA